ncbi:MAG: queuosine precursor transporter [Chitinophagaceae bacterium]|nr:queuosine precursor transporter [Chitinophagaceae bacterium]HMN33472.1 queuosine precursor transporter [Chitinophagaceae bacterium]
MIHQIMRDKSVKLFIILAGLFSTTAIVAELIGGKIFSLEKTIGIEPITFTLLGEQGLSFNLTAGVLLWPIVFVMTDIINEYYGMIGVRYLSYLTVALISIAFVSTYFAIRLTPADWWVVAFEKDGVPNMQLAFEQIFGQGMWIIIASIIAFLIGQLLDVFIFHKIKQFTGEKMIWLRATGSTLISQLIDSLVVIFIAFKLGQGWSWAKVLDIALVGYFYKFFVAILVTPLIYIIHEWIERYLGKPLAEKMKKSVME